MPAISDPAILQTKAFAVLVIRICFEFRASDFEFPRLGVVPLIVGPGKACALAKKKLPDYDKTVRPLRDALEEEILNSIPNTELKGHKEQRLANTTNITLHGLESVALLILLDEKGISCLPGPKRDQPASRIPSRMSVAGFRRCRPVRLPTVYHPQTYRHKRLPVLCTGQ